MATKKNEVIKLQSIEPKYATITIEGDGDIILNKMNDVTARALIDARNDKAKSIEKSNVWEEIITSIHWANGKPTEFSEDSLIENLDPEKNAPCITGFGLKKSFCQAVVRNGIDTYSTKFDAAVNIVANGGLVPIQFAEHFIDEKLMQPKQGKPVLSRLNRFTGWKATFTIKFVDSIYSLEQIVNIINLAGFGIGIASGRPSGYGRYHVIDVK